MTFEILKEKLSEIEEKQLADWGLFITLLNEIEQAAPESLFLPRQKGYIKKAARLFFISEVCERQITSFKKAYGQELWIIDQWWEGHIGQFKDDPEFNQIINVGELSEWWIEHKAEIRQLAKKIREEKLKK